MSMIVWLKPLLELMLKGWAAFAGKSEKQPKQTPQTTVNIITSLVINHNYFIDPKVDPAAAAPAQSKRDRPLSLIPKPLKTLGIAARRFLNRRGRHFLS